MQINRLICVAIAVLAVTTVAAGQGFKIYPGASKYTPPDTKENREVAKDLATSKSWAQVQRPFIGSMGANLEPQDVRDETVINVSQKK
jgi:hypothetical protein